MDRFSKTLMSTFAIQKIQLDPAIWTKTSGIQVLYGAWVNMAHVAIGLGFGFATVQVSQLSSPNSEMHITRSEASWIVSVLLLFCPIGCIISGFVMDRSGRRIMIIFSQVPMFIGWLYTSFAKTPKHIIIARAITGVGCGLAMSPPRIYCTEISLPNIRGVLGSFPNTALSIGITVQAALDTLFHWKVLCYICCVFTCATFCSFMLLPETPYFILKTKTTQDARAHLVKFRGPLYNIDREMEQLIDFKDCNNIRKLTYTENIEALFSKASCKPFLLMVTYIFIGQAAGNSCVMFWAIELLTDAKSSIDAHTGNILLATTRMFMGITTSILIYKVSRRKMALISAIGLTFTCFAIGVYLVHYDEPSVFPLICLTLYNVFSNLGYTTLPHLMALELLPLQVRGMLGGALVSIHCLMMFASTKVEPFIVDFLGVNYTFLLFGGCSLAGVVFVYFYLPETKDLTLQEIEEYYSEIRPTLISQRRIMTLDLIAMQSTPKSSSSKLNRDVPKQMTSRSSMLAKLEAQRQLEKIYKNEESSTEDESIKSTKSPASQRSRVIFQSKEDDDTDVESTKSTDSKKSQKDGKSKKSKESGTDDKDTSEDKYQASTSKKNTQ